MVAPMGADYSGVVIQLVLLPARVAFRDREITGPRIRALLALLADDLRAGCGTSRLVDGIWPDERPENPTKALQVVVSRARSQLGADVIASTPTGYRLALDDEQVDVAAVLGHAARAARVARAADHAACLAHADAGLALFAEAAPGAVALDDPLGTLRADRDSARRSLWRSRALALARLGQHAEALEPLTELVAERPRDEELLLELLRCEAATAGPPTALERYDRYRRALRDDLGTDPGPALRELHQQLLDGAAPTARHHVPHEPNPLLGRETDLDEVARLLRVSRVTSIVGPGGLGKTRLAQAVSRAAEQRTVHFVPLAGVPTDDDVAPAVASAIGATELKWSGAPLSARSVGEIIANAVGHGPALLVLDNCEHVVGAAAELATELVARTTELRILTTSRTPLAISAESVYPLPQLPLPTTVELFTQRATAARPDVELPADVVAELCQRLDGLPLAVELAAARARVMSVPEIAARLSDRFALLRGGARDAPERHRTLHAVVDWSWNLLDEPARAAMRALSVFAGGFGLDAAERMLGGDTAVDVLTDLVDQSLLTVTDTDRGARYSMLETMREYGAARRAEAGETERVAEDFLAWARELGLANHEQVFGAEPAAVVRRITVEHDNLQLALRHAIERGDGATVAAVGAVLAALWTFEGNYARVATLTEQTAYVVGHYRPEPELVEATRTVCALCVVNTFISQGPRAMRALVALRRLPPARPDTLARAMQVIVTEIRDAPVAENRARLLALSDSDAPLVAGLAAGVVSYMWENERDRDRALAAAERMLDMLADAESPWLPMMARSRLAELYLLTGRGREAVTNLEIAIQHMETIGMIPDGIGLRWGLVMAQLQLGAYDEAERAMEIAMADMAMLEDSWNIQTTFGIGASAEIHLGRGEIDEGLRLWRRASELMATEAVVTDIAAFGTAAWRLEVDAVCALAHLRHDRDDQVTDLVDRLADEVTELLVTPPADVPPTLMLFPLCGALMLAVGVADLHRGEPKTGVALIALADEFRCTRNFHPTMAPAWTRELAATADRSSYEDAVADFAGASPDELRTAARSVLRARRG
jgi:predicted ATPase/DNA-binding SARP family transcriptional activator